MLLGPFMYVRKNRLEPFIVSVKLNFSPKEVLSTLPSVTIDLNVNSIENACKKMLSSVQSVTSALPHV